MSELKLYTFFCAEYQEINTPIIEVIIDRSLNFIGDITEYIGQHVYKDYPYDNPIFSGNKYYFGGTSADAFFDCLTDYLNLRNKNVMLCLKILSKSEGVTDKELFLFLNAIAIAMLSYDYDSRLKVYISKEILDIYLKESKRLLDLDTHADDFAIY
ncbi:hypothetical protein [Acinetobacter seifertii]|uniref:hypothetical protein n=1 Tax=Acinetobacter seifertii TaxID=1530123 RepID=UPI0032B3C278